MEMSVKLDNNGTIEYISAERVIPLAAADIKSEQVTISIEGTRYDFTKSNTGARGISSFNLSRRLPRVYALVEGGWLPPMFCMSELCVFDRNIMSNLERTNNTPEKQDITHWLEFLKSSDNFKVSTSFAEIESAVLGQCESSLTFGLAEDCLPKVERFALSTQQAAILENLKRIAHTSENVEFLIQSSALIADKVKKINRIKVARELIDAAAGINYPVIPHLLILALSCLYNSHFARGVIKPSKLYTGKDARNCINDTLFVDFIMYLTLSTNLRVAGMTCDKGLAAYWSALQPRTRQFEDGGFAHEFNLSVNLFPDAPEDEIKEMLATLTPSVPPKNS